MEPASCHFVALCEEIVVILDVLPGDQIFCKPLVHCIMYVGSFDLACQTIFGFKEIGCISLQFFNMTYFLKNSFKLFSKNSFITSFFSLLLSLPPPLFNVIMYLLLPYSCYATLTPFKTVEMSSQLESELKNA